MRCCFLTAALTLLRRPVGENEANVRWLLDTHLDMQLVQQAPRLGLPGLAGTVRLPDGTLQQLLSEAEAALVQRFDPSAELDTIGFFIAKFVKRREEEREEQAAALAPVDNY